MWAPISIDLGLPKSLLFHPYIQSFTDNSRTQKAISCDFLAIASPLLRRRANGFLNSGIE
jgi:hypothetical protein